MSYDVRTCAKLILDQTPGNLQTNYAAVMFFQSSEIGFLYFQKCYFSSVIQEEFWWNMSGSFLCALNIVLDSDAACGNLIHKLWLLSLEINLIFLPGPGCYYRSVNLCHHITLLCRVMNYPLYLLGSGENLSGHELSKTRRCPTKWAL